MSNTGKGIVGILVVVLIVLGVYQMRKSAPEAPPAASNATAPVGETGPIKIGFIAPLTGDAAVYGEPGKNVVALAIDEINASGGINGRSMEAIYEDGKCSGRDAASAMQKLANVDKVQVVIGGFCSSESLAAVPIAASAKVALFSPGSSSPDLTDVSPYFFRDYPSDASQGQVLANVAYGKENMKKVAMIQEQTDYALGIAKSFTKTFEEQGGKVVKQEFPTVTNDFKTIIAKMRDEKPDALFLSVQTPAAGERVLKQMNELGWKPRLFVSDIIPGDHDLVKRDAAWLEGAIGAEFSIDPSNTKLSQLIAAYKTKYGKELPFQSYGQTEYDSVYIVAAALKKVGNDGQKIAEWAHSLKDWEGASGKITILPSGDRASGHTPEIIKDGKVEAYTK